MWILNLNYDSFIIKKEFENGFEAQNKIVSKLFQIVLLSDYMRVH